MTVTLNIQDSNGDTITTFNLYDDVFVSSVGIRTKKTCASVAPVMRCVHPANSHSNDSTKHPTKKEHDERQRKAD